MVQGSSNKYVILDDFDMTLRDKLHSKWICKSF